MSVILVEKDLFVELESKLAVDQARPFIGNKNVRRPLWGLRIKDPRFAYIQVYQDLGGENYAQPLSLIDSSAPGGISAYAGNHNFILQSVSEQRQEKVQIIETFGDHFAFFYGEKPIVLSVQGILFNSIDFNWKNEFLANYEQFLRGTKCVENKTRVFLGWDDVLAQGYLLNVQIRYDKDTPLIVPFSFNMLLTKPPLDLSSAAGALESPDPNTMEPGQYRTLEAGPRPDGWLPEYISEPGEGTPLWQDGSFFKIGIDGAVERVTGSNGSVSESAESQNTADWISGRNRTTQQYFPKERALLQTILGSTVDQTNVDSVTVAQGLRTNPEAFPLASRDSATLRVANSLDRGVYNTAAVIADAPVVE